MMKEKSNMKVVIMGGTGLIGSKVVKNLSERGYEVVAASPNSGVNTLTGEGLAEVLEGASVVVDEDWLSRSASQSPPTAVAAASKGATSNQ